MDNLKEFKALIERYENITIGEIERVILGKFVKLGYNTVPCALTGFGDADTCTLCAKINWDHNDCPGCVWSENTQSKCNYGKNMVTYDAIYDASSNKELLEAYKARAKYMRSILKDN